MQMSPSVGAVNTTPTPILLILSHKTGLYANVPNQSTCIGVDENKLW